MDFNVTNGRKHLDCLLVGHNEMEFSEYHKNVSHMGNNSGALRDLRLNYVSYGGYEYTATNLAEIAFEKKGMKLNFGTSITRKTLTNQRSLQTAATLDVLP